MFPCCCCCCCCCWEFCGLTPPRFTIPWGACNINIVRMMNRLASWCIWRRTTLYQLRLTLTIPWVGIGTPGAWALPIGWLDTTNTCFTWYVGKNFSKTPRREQDGFTWPGPAPTIGALLAIGGAGPGVGGAVEGGACHGFFIVAKCLINIFQMFCQWWRSVELMNNLLALVPTLLSAADNSHLKIGPQRSIQGLVLLNVVRWLPHRFQHRRDWLHQ